jgi:hypothetical protein
MSKKVKLVIDSIVEDRIRILITTDDVKNTLDVDVRNLKKILKRKKLIEGRSYVITFEDSSDYNALTERIDEEFKPKGNIKVKDTTKSDEATIRQLQKKLGLQV